MSQSTNDLLNSYIKWLKDNIFIRELHDDVIEITTPFLDHHNDHLQIYAIKSGDKIRITDDGYVITDLMMSGVDIKSSRKRRELMQVILNGYGVKLSNNELYLETTKKNFPQHKHMLLQAMLAINDMFMTARETVAGIFYEDVEQFLILNEIRYTDNISFIGKSGFSHKFDFVIPHSKAAPERIIQTINNPTRDKAENLLFSWSDTRETRKTNSTLYAFLNDNEKSVNEEVINALTHYEVTPVLWSQRKKYARELAA
jgi:hypothetical protein